MLDIIIDTFIDGLKLIPFLFVAFLIIEIIEHKLSSKTKNIISSSGKIGPLIGSLLGIVPQCGFSVLATNLYITRIISLGTLISIYLSTSDEMLPILLSQNVEGLLILKILGLKFFIGMLMGFLIDFVLKNKKEKTDYHICNEDDCHCKDSLIKSSIIHTLKTLSFIMLISFILNILMSYLDATLVERIFMKNNIFSSFLTSLIGLIPNCGASVVLTELYVNNVISLGSVISGLLTGSGVAILVLFKSNKDYKENLKILCLVYFIGAFSGFIINIIENIL